MYVRRLPTSLLRPAFRLSTCAQAIAGRRRREIQSRYMFTKPLTPVAGQPVEIYYNPGGWCWWMDSVCVCEVRVPCPLVRLSEFAPSLLWG
jgi:hypothetical protein